MTTPSQQTNQILELLQSLANGEGDWSKLAELCALRLQGQEQNRQEFESKAQTRGELFLEQAKARLEAVKSGFDQYAACLTSIRESAEQKKIDSLPVLGERLKGTTHQLFADLEGYADFYFAWGENQSPLVTMIRQAVEAHSRSALQSTQAQRILEEMNQHFNKEDPTKAGEA